MWKLIEHIDINLFYLINRGGKNSLFDLVMPILSDMKYFYIPLALLWVFMVAKKNLKTRMIAVTILLLITASDLVNSRVLKPVFGRAKPYYTISNIHYYNNTTWTITSKLEKAIKTKKYAFPSSHATNLFAAAFFLSYYYPKFFPFFYLIAIMVGYSRIYLGEHYPFDVIAGGIEGTLFGLIFVWIGNQIMVFFERKRKERHNF